MPSESRKITTKIKAIIQKEHEDLGDGNSGCQHSLGAAVCYIGTTAPTNAPDGATALADTNIDKARLWLDTNYDPPALKYWDGDSWETLGLVGHATDLNLILKNLEVTYTAGAKDITIKFRGMETTNECDLAHIEVSHEGSADDHKGQLSIKMNDGDDGTSPSKEALRIKSTGKIDVANSLSVLDENDMASDDAEVVATQQSIKAYIDGLLNTDAAVAKGWANVAADGTKSDSYNVASTAKDSTGVYTITWDTDFADTNYAAFVTATSNLRFFAVVDNKATGSCKVYILNATGGAADLAFQIVAFGAQ